MSDFKIVSLLNPSVVVLSGATGPAIAANGGTQTSGTVFFSNANNVSFGMAGSVMTASIVPGGGLGDGYNILAAGTQTANTTGSVLFNNGGGVTFGMSNNSVITATVATNYMASNQSSNFVNTSQSSLFDQTSNTTNYVAASNSSLFQQTSATSNITSNAMNTSVSSLFWQTSQTMVGTNTTFGGTNVSGSMTLNSAGLNLQVSLSEATDVWNAVGTNTIAGTNTSGSWANDVYAISGAGVLSVGVSNNTLILSVPAGGGGGDGYNSAQFTNSTANSTMPLVWAGNSNGSGNVTIGLTGSTITMSAPSGGGGGAGNVIAAGGSTAATSGTVVFSNSNGMSFGLNGATVTASYTVPTQTVDTNKAGTGYTSTTTAGTLAGVTNNTQGLSMAWPPYITTYAQSNQTVASGNIAGTGFTSTTTVGSVPTGTLGTNGLNLAVPAWITTYVAQTNQTAASGNIAGTGYTSTTTAGVTPAVTLNTAGLSMGWPAFITTYAAQTNQTVASGGIAGTNTSFGGTNVSASMTMNSSGLTISASVPSPNASWFAVGNTTQTSSGSSTSDVMYFSGAGIASLGVTGNTVIVSVPAGGGGGDGYNIVQMGTSGNTTGTSWSTLSGTVSLYASGALQISQNNSNQIVFIDGDGWALYGNTSGTSSYTLRSQDSLYFSGGPNITLSGNSNTIVVSAAAGGGGATLNDWEPVPLGASTTTVPGQNTVYFQPLYPPSNISYSAIEVISNISVSSSAIAGWTKGTTVSYGIYAQDTGTNNTRITLIGSSSFAVNMTASSNASFMVSISQGTNSTTYSTAASIHSAVNGTKIVSLPFVGSMSAGGNYFFAMIQSTSTAGANVASTVGMLWNNEYAASFGGLAPNTLAASNASYVHEPFGFIYATTSGALPGTVPNTAWSVTNNMQPYLFFEN